MLKHLFLKMSRRQVLGLGRLLGMMLHVLSLPHRRLVRRNLKFCYPLLSSNEIRKLSRRIFRNAGITVLEIYRLSVISREDLLGMFRITGEKNLINALKADRGAIAISAHLANWECAFQFAGCYFGKPFTGVARNMQNKALDSWFKRLRTRFGNKVIYKKGALPEMRQTLRRGEILGLTVDQSRYKQGIEVTFFGRKATATPAAALLALRCRSPVIPIYCTRELDGMLTLHVMPPLPIRRSGDLRVDLEVNTQAMMNSVEGMIRRYPEQWIWFQRPWKKTYPQLYPEWEAIRLHRKKRKETSLSS
jgi:KDO2-lipid IV(A) lauroyltransferase